MKLTIPRTSRRTVRRALTAAVALVCAAAFMPAAARADLRAKGAEFSSGPDDHGYGIVAMVKVPGADDVQLYQPRHRPAYGL